MTQTFILQNQDKLFFGKNKEWVDGYDANSLFKTLFKDEAINQMVEISSKDYKQRVKVISCDINEKGLPIVDADIMPAPLPKVPKGQKSEDLFAESASLEQSESTVETVLAENDESIDQEPEEDDELEEEEILEFTIDSETPDDTEDTQTALL
jgi:hypothetical protein